MCRKFFSAFFLIFMALYSLPPHPAAATEAKQKRQRVGWAGGHADQLSISEDGRFVVKQTSLEEAHFYCWLRRLAGGCPLEGSPAECASVTDACKDLCDLHCPTGDCPLRNLRQQTANADVEEKHKRSAQQLIRWLPELHGVHAPANCMHSRAAAYLKMENLIFDLENPIVIDVKIGTRLCADGVTSGKLERSRRRARARGADTIGLSFSGLWGEEDREEVKWDGGSRCKAGNFMPTSIELYVELFRAFLVSGGDPAGVYRQLLQLLQDFREVWGTQQLVNLYGSSLLLTAGDLGEDEEKKRVVRVKLIDFAHPTALPLEKEEGFMRGLDSLIQIVKEAAKSTEGGVGALGFRDLLSVWQARSIQVPA